MEFRLTYRGPLLSANKGNRYQHVQEIRRHFHPQLMAIWESPHVGESRKHVDPARDVRDGDVSILEQRGVFQFAPLISAARGWNAVSDISVLFLRPGEPGRLFGHGGDIDNRIKTLLDGLRVPAAHEVPHGDAPRDRELPFFCLLQDDALVTSLSVTSDRLLAATNDADVELIIHVQPKVLGRTWANEMLW
ncbi:MAG: hypothetical protein AB7H66_02885 [Hyphomonadaceae bacterium]